LKFHIRELEATNLALLQKSSRETSDLMLQLKERENNYAIKRTELTAEIRRLQNNASIPAHSGKSPAGGRYGGGSKLAPPK
jgi:hypothetical protein